MIHIKHIFLGLNSRVSLVLCFLGAYFFSYYPAEVAAEGRSALGVAESSIFCRAFAAHYNQKLPEKLDQFNILNNVSCPVYGQRTYVTYRYTVMDERVTATAVEETRPGIVNSWCTTDEMYSLLRLGDGVQYLYYRTNGTLIGRITLGKEDC